MSELEMRVHNGKTYRNVPQYGIDGNIECYRWVEVSVGPVVPPASLFTEVSPVNNVRAMVEVTESDMEDFAEEICEMETTPIDATECEADVELHLEAQEPRSNLTLDNMEPQKTDEITSVMGDSDDDATSSAGSSSIDHTAESDSEPIAAESFKEDSEEVSTQKAVHKLVWAGLDEFDFDSSLCTLDDGYYLTNVDGKHVFELADIDDFINDGKVHRLHFSDLPNQFKRREQIAVCYKPVYQTLKNIQVRSGPGSKFEKSGIVSGREQVVVIQEGLMECDSALVHQWMTLHLPEEMVYDFSYENLTFQDFLEKKYAYACDLEDSDDEEDRLHKFVAEITEDEEQEQIFLKAFAAAERKVKIMYKENGVAKYGWISKKKNSGPLIKRVFGKNLASVVVKGVQTHPFGTPGLTTPPKGTFVEECTDFYMHNTKNSVIKYIDEYTGEKKERTETRNTYPPMKFFTELAKFDIKEIVGSTRFTIDWQGEFRQARFEGLEQKLVSVNGKNRYRTGYIVPDQELVITFQKYKDALKFMEADLYPTRFGSADTEWDPEFENLQAVELGECPEHYAFQQATQSEFDAKIIADVRAEMGVHLVEM